MSDIFTTIDEVQRNINKEEEARLYRETGGDPLMMSIGRSSGNLGQSLGNFIRHMAGKEPYEDPRLAQARQTHAAAKGFDIATAEGMRGFAKKLNDIGLYEQAIKAATRARELESPDRKIIKGADGYNYYQDTQERVLPNVQSNGERRVIEAADGYKYYSDTGERVLPNVRKDQSKDIRNQRLENEAINFDRSAKLRGEFTKESKVFNDVTDSFIRVQKSAEDPSAAGDLALIFNYMKILDPGSVVREGEFANAQNSGSIPQVVRARYNKVLRGERLSDSQRADFYNRAHKLYDGARGKQQRLLSRYEKLAYVYGLSPENIIYDYSLPSTEGKTSAELTYNPNTGRIE